MCQSYEVFYDYDKLDHRRRGGVYVKHYPLNNILYIYSVTKITDKLNNNYQRILK